MALYSLIVLMCC